MWNSTRAAFRYISHEAEAFAYAESGVTSIEYALIAVLVAMVILAGVTNVGTVVLGLYEYVANEVAAAV